ncbi:hypothetical protein C922_01776 [Plasmodium inui San Antonio 1]|uniref:Uncharacterized protein n=1 Tax=Plasmodium inui San Antonio 1 TaxID=1237626 RepID=W7AQ91_9APIC|nr:hypothetical protein C922_01776 [Plasmodium inui San Antonio 1]EUD67591.1 hypothetical protein C922_01776 [Plasmodium inui San Antonio 1]
MSSLGGQNVNLCSRGYLENVLFCIVSWKQNTVEKVKAFASCVLINKHHTCLNKRTLKMEKKKIDSYEYNAFFTTSDIPLMQFILNAACFSFL